MYDNYNYPAGADNPSAPWNQPIPEPIEIPITISICMSKEIYVQTQNYEECERDENGNWISYRGLDEDDLIEKAQEEYDSFIKKLEKDDWIVDDLEVIIE